MKNRSLTLLSLSLALAACGGNESASEEASPETTQTPAAHAAPTPAPAPAAEAAPAPAPAQPASAQAPTVTLRPGFMPDPHTVQGTAGGPVDASSLSAGCVGHVSSDPSHVLQAEGTFSRLRIMAHSGTDTTLVVQRPDGTYSCNDDGEGLDPLVELTNAPAGTYRIWVGTWRPDASAPYTVGISEMSSVTPSRLGS